MGFSGYFVRGMHSVSRQKNLEKGEGEGSEGRHTVLLTKSSEG